MEKEPLISIIIINWNGYEVTSACLKSLHLIDYTNFNIILVDNGSTDGSAEKLYQDFPTISHLKLSKNLGFTGGNNAGFALAKVKFNPDYYLMLNNDTVVKPDFLPRMIQPFSDSLVFATVPKIFYFEPDNTLWFAGGHISTLTGIGKAWGANCVDKGQHDREREINYMNGCCALVSAKCIESVGTLDDIYFANTEDVDYSLRIVKSGHKIVYVPTAVIFHKVNYSFKKNKGQWFAFYLSTRNKILLHRKYASPLKSLLFVVAFGLRWVIYLTLKLSFKGDFKSVKSLYIGLADGITSRLRYVS